MSRHKQYYEACKIQLGKFDIHKQKAGIFF